MRVLSFVLAAVFLVGAIVQWNDPDPLAWIVGYLVGAALSFHAARGGRAFAPNVAAALVFGLWFASLAATIPDAPDEAFTSFQMQSSSHEEPREAVGLLLLAVWCGVLALQARRAGAESGD